LHGFILDAIGLEIDYLIAFIINIGLTEV